MRILRRILLSVVILAVLVTGALYILLRGSLPKLDGSITASVSAPVSIERDALGVATITAANRPDLAFATGYAHGQDRWFQMDLQRRVAAGELSALLGGSLIDTDRALRRHGFRKTALTILTQISPEQKQLLERYVAGVNAGRDSLSVRPFEYLLLGASPEPWKMEDCLLVAFAMYIDLNDSSGARELE
ncbi:MAG TPA: penicillin acylase family protein, partial [Steroidobacteraceae bacterium]|nr:penicillin acylase family protein [Steroidobacteraceae bacterium]